MHTIYADARKSGISLIGDLPWGSHFCQFYTTKKDLLDILVPYFRAGLENNEFCVWITSGIFGEEDAKKALNKAVPNLEEYARKGQIEIIPYGRRHAGRGKAADKTVVSKLDRAVSGGFDGLRLACNAFPEKKGSRVFTCYGAEAVSRYNIISVYAYPRNEFDAIGLMEVVKNHRFALVRNADRWEVIESSEARIAKDALKRSEEKLQSLFSNMSEGFAYNRIVLDERGKPCDYVFLEANDAFERLTGLKKKFVLGRRVTEVLPGIDKDPADWIKKFGTVALSGKPLQFESYSGHLARWYSVSAFSPHKGYFAVTFSDITERKQADESIRLAKEEWELTFNTVPDLLAVIDTQHRVVRVNKAMADRLGLTPEQCVGLHCYKAVHGLSNAPDFCPHSQTCRYGSRHVADIHEPRLGGDFLVTTTPLYDKTGRLIGSIHMARDVTEQKKSQDRIISLNEQLRRKVDELASANSELEAFSYSVSHDLRAPLRSIAGFGKILLEDYAGKLDEEGMDALERVLSATRQMGQLIDDLLNLSRVIRAGMNCKSVGLSDIAKNIAKILRETQPERQVEFIIAEGLFANGDEHLLRIVLDNLLGNAWKFTEKNAMSRIEFGLGSYEGKAAFFVKDNGAGFDMAYAGKLFNPFQRLHSADEFPGTGIGLATVKRIIERHGGEVWIEGEVDKGTVVFFTLAD